MPQHVVATGASTAGPEPLTAIIQRLPRSIDAAMLVGMHMPANGSAVLPAILARAGDLPASFAVDRQALEAGRVYVAPIFTCLSKRSGCAWFAFRARTRSGRRSTRRSGPWRAAAVRRSLASFCPEPYRRTN